MKMIISTTVDEGAGQVYPTAIQKMNFAPSLFVKSVCYIQKIYITAQITIIT